MVFGISVFKKAPTLAGGDLAAPSTGAAARQTVGGAGVGGGAAPKASGLTVNEFVARTKRCREKGLEPTKPELVAYARYLGIDTIADGDLMWISEQALNAPLPVEWTEHHDGADRVFYYNVQTRGSSWTHPLEQLHRDTYKQVVTFRSGGLNKDEQAEQLDKMRTECEEAEREAHRELQMWQEHTDPQGQKFYHHSDKQQSVWTDPRPATCHCLYLRMKMLRVLSKHAGLAVGVRAQSPAKDEWLPKDRPHKGEDSTVGGGRAGHATTFPVASDPLPGDEGEEGRGHRRRRKKGQSSKHRSLSEGAPPEGTSHRTHGRGEEGPLNDKLMPPAMMDLKRPSTSAVNEVRQALGVAPSLPPMGGGRHGASRLPTPPGLESGTAARPRVRAGIRLQPLQVA